jgi:DNA repair exonuclease SbcCD ATPase subunit
LGAQLGETLTQSLAGPLNTITEAMRNSTKANSEAVTGMLENLLTGFMAKLEDTFGGQMRGIHEQMDRSMNAMTTVQQSLQKLVDDINRSGEEATTRLSGTLEDAMKQAASNQQLLTEQMRQFVDEFRKLAANEQAKSMRTMDDAIAKVMQTVEAAVQGLEAVRKSAADQEQSRNDNLANRTRDLVSGLGTGVDTLLEAIREQVALTKQNIDAIGNVTTRAIDGMNTGALTMGTAAERFQTAGNSVSGVFERSAEVAEHLGTASTALQSAAAAVRQGFEQYDNTRKTVDANVQVLTNLIEHAKKEAGLSRQMLTDLERIVAQLRAAEAQSEKYLEGVSKTLAKAFEDFGTQLVEQIRKAIGETDRHLGGGVQQLSGVVQQIGVAVSRLKKV